MKAVEKIPNHDWHSVFVSDYYFVLFAILFGEAYLDHHAKYNISHTRMILTRRSKKNKQLLMANWYW